MHEWNQDLLAHRTRGSGDVYCWRPSRGSAKTNLKSLNANIVPHTNSGEEAKNSAAVKLQYVRVLSASARRLLPLSEQLKRQEPPCRSHVDRQLGALPPVTVTVLSLHLHFPTSTAQSRSTPNRTRHPTRHYRAAASRYCMNKRAFVDIAGSLGSGRHSLEMKTSTQSSTTPSRRMHHGRFCLNHFVALVHRRMPHRSP